MQRIGDYQVLGEVARGGMGVVFHARGRDGRDVALKLLLAGRGATDAQRRRFRREVAALSKLDHPNIVSCLDAGESGGYPYLVMEWAPGEDLADRIARGGPLEPRDAARIARAIAKALHYAHGLSVLHRDVKPANVIIGPDGEPRITDFGLAKDVDAAQSRLSKSGMFLGSPGYLPPEQAAGDLERIGPRSDVYSLGATLYACLTGVPPIQGESLAECMAATMSRAPTPPSHLRAKVPRDLEAICMRCLEKDPDDRYLSARDLAKALDDYLTGKRRRSRRLSAQAPPVGRARIFAGVAGAAGALLVLALILAFASGGNAPAGEPATPAQPPGGELVASAPPTGGEASGDPAQPTSPTSGEPPKDEDREFAGVSPAARALFDQALSAVEGGDRAAAIRLLDQAIELQPEFGLAFMNRGALLSQLEQFERALADMDRAVELMPWRSQARRQRAVVRANSGDPAGALPDLEAVREAEGDDVALLIDLSRIYYMRKDHPRAIAVLGRALELRPGRRDQLQVYGLLLRSHRALENYVGMLTDYDALAKLTTPNNMARLENDRATIYMRLERYEEAIAGFTRAIELQPQGSGLAHLNRGQANMKLGKPQLSVEDFERAGELLGANHQLAGEIRTRLAEAHAALGTPAPKQERPEEDKAKAAEVARLKGNSLREAGKRKEAEAAYRVALELDPKNAKAYCNLAVVTEEQGDRAAAMPLYDKALELDPELAAAWHNRALARFAGGDKQRGLGDMDRALELERDDPEAWLARARLRVLTGDAKGAFADLDQALALDPDHIDSLSQRGQLRLASGDPTNAVKDCGRALELMPKGDPRRPMAELFAKQARALLGLQGAGN